MALLAACGSDAENPAADAGVRDLFACNIEDPCEPLCSHIGTGDCSSAGTEACHESPGVAEPYRLIEQSRPGPGDFQSDSLTIYLPNDMRIVQARSRSCGGDASCDVEALDWVLAAPERCEGASCQPFSGDCAAVLAVAEG